MGNNKYEVNQTTALPAGHTFYENAANLIAESRRMVASTANTVICVTNFEIGRMIVQDVLKDPFVLEFLGMEEKAVFAEEAG